MTDRSPWAAEEVAAVVDDYLHMLTLELSGQHYVKSQHRQRLKAQLRGRSDGAIERKHQNISAIMIELGFPYVPGYKPLSNYQSLLLEVVSRRLSMGGQLDAAAEAAAKQPATAPLAPNFDALLTDPPTASTVGIREHAPAHKSHSHVAKRDYLALEARNRSLGKAGEELVACYEQHRLHRAGKRKLSEKVEHVAVTQGDGLGYDVLSFDTDGQERLIEVKTTAFGKDTPFFLSDNELALSKEVSDRFHLYRIFEFRRQPRMFTLMGAIDDRCRLDPISYLARF
ncbi:hypothetical protein PC39_14207 [Salinisphaera sp. PC39]|uniref:DUF3883 domain-containing protein n=1 Tax=Salinisphaera sp. PC39 TaxID=1304156 RepID=UPI00333F8FF2